MISLLLLTTEGEMREVFPTDGLKFSLKELQDFVGGLVQIVPLPSGNDLVCNEEGRLSGLPFNEQASKLWRTEYPIDRYPNNNPPTIHGDVLIAKPGVID